MVIASDTVGKPVRKPADIAAIARAVLAAEDEIDRKKEHFWAMGLDSGHRVSYFELVTLGILNATQVHPREVFRRAIMDACESMVVIHNHPSGDPTPSGKDRTMTKQLTMAGQWIGVEILDHVIIGKDTYYSFAEANELTVE